MNKSMKKNLFSAETLAEMEMSEIFGGCDAERNGHCDNSQCYNSNCKNVVCKDAKLYRCEMLMCSARHSRPSRQDSARIRNHQTISQQHHSLQCKGEKTRTMKNNRLYLIAVFLLLCYGNVSVAQTDKGFSIKGRTVDNTKSVVSYANCVLVNGADSSFVVGTTGNNDGRFLLHVESQGEYLLVVRHIGHEQVVLPISLSGDVDLGDITLQKGAETLNTVTVTAQKPLYSDDGEKTYYHVSDDPSIQNGTIADALQNSPGVEVDAKGIITLLGRPDVTVYINDKPAQFEGDALAQYIKNMPANSIERIEVIENPSARYKASGAVVNIVTKRGFSMNQLLCVGLNANNNPRLSPWASYVWANEKVSVNLYANLAFRKERTEISDIKNLFTDDTTLSAAENYSYNELQKYDNQYMGAIINYNIGDFSMLSAGVDVALNHIYDNSVYDVTHKEYIYDTGDYSYVKSDDHTQRNNGATLNVDFLHMFGMTGRSLKIGFVSSLYNNPDELTSSRDYKNMLQDIAMYNINRRKGHRSSFTLDYSDNNNKLGQLEAGLSVGLHKSIYEDSWDSIFSATLTKVHDNVRSFNNIMKDNEIEQYITLRRMFGPLNVKAGVRLAENWKMLNYYDMPVETDAYDVDRFFFNVLPSLHVNYKLNKQHNLNMSYSYRFGRPGAGSMSSFQRIKMESFSYGNPDLTVSHYHYVTLGWSYFFQKGSASLSAYHWKQKDGITQISDVAFHPYFGRIVEASYYINDGVISNTGLQFSFMLRPTSTTTVNLGASLTDYYYDVPIRPGIRSTEESLNYSIRLNATTKLWKVVNVYLTAFYKGKQHNVMSYCEPMFLVNAGLSADLLNDRLSLFLDVSDLFNSSNINIRSTNIFLDTYSKSQFLTMRAITVGATWRFGKTALSNKAQQGSKDN